MVEHILPQEVTEKLTQLEHEVLMLCLGWFSNGITQGKKIEEQRPVITSVMNEPVLMIETKQWSGFSQTSWWRSKPWGGVNTHPVQVFADIITQAMERQSEDE
jgi:hypothetical protein